MAALGPGSELASGTALVKLPHGSKLKRHVKDLGTVAGPQSVGRSKSFWCRTASGEQLCAWWGEGVRWVDGEARQPTLRNGTLLLRRVKPPMCARRRHVGANSRGMGERLVWSLTREEPSLKCQSSREWRGGREALRGNLPAGMGSGRRCGSRAGKVLSPLHRS